MGCIMEKVLLSIAVLFAGHGISHYKGALASQQVVLPAYASSHSYAHKHRIGQVSPHIIGPTLCTSHPTIHVDYGFVCEVIAFCNSRGAKNSNTPSADIDLEFPRWMSKIHPMRCTVSSGGFIHTRCIFSTNRATASKNQSQRHAKGPSSHKIALSADGHP